MMMHNINFLVLFPLLSFIYFVDGKITPTLPISTQIAATTFLASSFGRASNRVLADDIRRTTAQTEPAPQISVPETLIGQFSLAWLDRNSIPVLRSGVLEMEDFGASQRDWGSLGKLDDFALQFNRLNNDEDFYEIKAREAGGGQWLTLVCDVNGDSPDPNVEGWRVSWIGVAAAGYSKTFKIERANHTDCYGTRPVRVTCESSLGETAVLVGGGSPKIKTEGNRFRVFAQKFIDDGYTIDNQWMYIIDRKYNSRGFDPTNDYILYNKKMKMVMWCLSANSKNNCHWTTNWSDARLRAKDHGGGKYELQNKDLIPIDINHNVLTYGSGSTVTSWVWLVHDGQWGALHHEDKHRGIYATHNGNEIKTDGKKRDDCDIFDLVAIPHDPATLLKLSN